MRVEVIRPPDVRPGQVHMSPAIRKWIRSWQVPSHINGTAIPSSLVACAQGAVLRASLENGTMRAGCSKGLPGLKPPPYANPLAALSHFWATSREAAR